ncbi:MAG: biopolymer transporter ExbD [Calditrichaeota bacterium]|nr:biopolymer transporter ExbD [Calditrichota bacterium]
MNQPICKIDMTPLVGVALILVIVFIVTSPLNMAPIDTDIRLPKAATVAAKSQTNITISLTSDLRLAVNEDWVRNNQFESRLQRELKKHPDRLVVIRADKDVRHKRILHILSQIKNAGASKIALATEQRRRVSL